MVGSLNPIEYVDFKGKKRTVSEKKWNISLMMPVKTCSDLGYVLIDDVRKMCQNNKLDFDAFLRWMTGQTCPIIESEGENKFNCLYPWDVESWVYHKIKYNKEPYFVD